MLRHLGARSVLTGFIALVAATATALAPVGSALAAPMVVPPGGGPVIEWGTYWDGVSTASPMVDVPTSLTGKTVTAIAGGLAHSMALTSDGTVTAWGGDSWGNTTLPASLTGKTVTAIAAGGHHSLALLSDGKVVAWGNNTYGQTDLPASVTEGTVTGIWAGGGGSLARLSDGTMVGWGRNWFGEATWPAALVGKTVTAISMGAYHNMALLSDGTVYAWGWNVHGQTDVPAGLAGVTAISAGGLHSLALLSDGTVVGWGGNYYGEATAPASLTGKTVTAIAAGYWHSLALLSDGTVVVWGDNTYDELNLPAGLTGVTAIAAGFSHSLVLVGPSDSTAPTITPSVDGNLGDNGWYTSDVAVSWTVSDPESAVTATSGCGPTTITTDTTGVTLTCTATSGGGTASSSVTIHRDATGSVLGWSSPAPADGSGYDFGNLPASPTCTATDATSGVTPSGCTVSGYSTAVGPHTLTATVRDNAGNTTTASRTYTVRAWTLRGFYSPVDMGGVWNTVKGGSTVPLKFEVFKGSTELTDTSVITGFTQQKVTCGTGGGIEDPIEVTTTGGTSLRYDTGAGQFIQNWKTPKTPGACYQVTMTTADNSALTALFKLK